MQHGWDSTYILSVEEGKGGIHQPWACGMDGAALTRCQLRRGGEAFISLGHAAWMGQPLLAVSWGGEGGIHQPWACGMDGAALTSCQLRRGREAFISPGHAAWMGQHLQAFS